MLWVDKHRPTSLEKLDYHKEQAAQLRELVGGRERAVLTVWPALRGWGAPQPAAPATAVLSSHARVASVPAPLRGRPCTRCRCAAHSLE